MKKLKRTDWYSAKQKPVWHGVYERNYGRNDVIYTYWDGKSWYISARTPEEAEKWFYAGFVTMSGVFSSWRGLQEHPFSKESSK